MSRFPGGGGFGSFRDGPGKGVAERLIETPYLGHAFLLGLLACFLFFLLDHRKFCHPVPISLLACMIVIVVFRNTQGNGWEYALIWIAGCVGCLAYGLDRLIRAGITRY